jgi:four helix bundle suffix protein
MSDLSDLSDLSDESDQSDLSDISDRSDPYNIRTASAEEAANTLLCLIHQASYLLKRQLERLEQQFLEEGGFTERLYHQRKAFRKNQRD